MATNNDATIDIPLEQVQSSGGGFRREGSTTALAHEDTKTSNEKRFHVFARGRRKKPEARVQGTGKVGYDGEEETVNTMGKVYKAIANFSVVTRYFLYVLPLGALIAVPIIVGATAAKKSWVGGVRMLWYVLNSRKDWSSTCGFHVAVSDDANFLPLCL
jgi:hypothetical protein